MFIVYSKDNCVQCVQAINLLKAKKQLISVKKLDVDFSREYLLGIVEDAGGKPPRSFPVIFKDTTLIGDLNALKSYIINNS